MGTHHATQQDDRLGGLVGRGVLTAAAALALAGGGTGVAFAGDAPAETGPDTSQAQDHGDDCSCEGHDGDRDQNDQDDQGWDGQGWDDQDDGGRQDQDQDDEGWQDEGGHPHSDASAPGSHPDGHAAPTHHGGATHAPTTQKIPHEGSSAETVPITSGVMR